MQTHTPGPWRIGDAGLTVFGPPNGKPSPETIAQTRNRANAHLIAAAPDMLNALEDICNHLDDPNMPVDELIYRARSAIAKAKGRSA